MSRIGRLVDDMDNPLLIASIGLFLALLLATALRAWWCGEQERLHHYYPNEYRDPAECGCQP